MGFTREQYKSGQHALTPSQVKKLLLSFSDLQEKALIALTASIGLRRADVISIYKNDFVPLRNESGQITTAKITYYEHKKKRTRTVYIPSLETIQILIMHVNTLPPKTEWLFPSPKGGKTSLTNHISERQAYDIFNEHLEKIGIARRPFHSLRATCYKLCQTAGWSQRKAAELLGDTLRVAEEHYNAPSVEEMQDIAKEKPLF